MGEWSFFQIQPEAIGHSWATGSASHQMRNLDMKMSNFGALKYGTRMDSDYTRINFGFKAKGILEGADAFGIHDLRGSGEYRPERDRNPYVWGSTVKKIRDDQFVRMGMSMGGKDYLVSRHTNNHQVDEPMHDVMDRKRTSASGMVSGKNYPGEGWRSFGRKYDKPVQYDGTLR